MKMNNKCVLVLPSLSMAILTGCGQPSDLKTENPAASAVSQSDSHTHGQSAKASHSASGHDHGAGPHQGTLADWGGGKYHVEFTVDHADQQATIYILGSDEKMPAPVRATDDKLLLTIKNPAFQVELTAVPLDGETDGACSRFVGKHEKLGVVQEFAGTISGQVEGTPYAADFQEAAHGHEHP